MNEKNFGHIRAMLKALKISAVFHPSVEFISSLGTVLVVAFGGYLAWRDGLRVADIVAFLLYLGLFYAPVTGLANLLENLQQSMAGAERVLDVLDAPQEIADRPGAEELKNVRGEIVFDHVSFSYGQDIPVLKDVSFRCEPGKRKARPEDRDAGNARYNHPEPRFSHIRSGEPRTGYGLQNRYFPFPTAYVLPSMTIFASVGVSISYRNPSSVRDHADLIRP